MNLNLQPIGVPILHKDFREAVNDRLSELNAYGVYLTQQLSEIKSAIENLQRSAIDVGTMEFAADHDGAWLQIRAGDNERKIALPLSGSGSSGILDGPDSLELDEVKRDAVRNISIEQNPTTPTLCLHTAGGIKRIPFPVASLTTTGVLKSGASEVSGGNPADGV